MNESSPLLISIPQPCHEDWNLMTPTYQGRHCAQCNQLVVDFTSMTDEEILDFIQTSKTSICGRLKNTQLSQQKPTKLKRIAKLFLKALAIAFILHSSEAANAQIQVQFDSVTNHENATVQGTVKGVKKEKLDFASVTLIQKGITKAGVKTDPQGKFKINEIAPGKYDLKITYIGYVEQIITGIQIKAGQTISIDPVLEQKKVVRKTVQVITVGTIRMVQPSEPNRKVIQKDQIKHSTY